MIYAQNWKVLLGNAAKTMVMVILFLIALTLVLFVMFGALLRAFGLPDLAVTGFALIIALLLALAIKTAFIDSFVLVRTMVAYMGVAPSTVITFDLYNKLSGISGKFKKLWEKGSQEQPPPQPAYAAAGGPQPAYAAASGPQQAYAATGGPQSAYTAAGGSQQAYTAAGGPQQAYTAAGGPQQAYTAAGGFGHVPTPGSTPVMGASPGTAADKPVFCGQCGAQNKHGGRFCQSCGSKMS